MHPGVDSHGMLLKHLTGQQISYIKRWEFAKILYMYTFMSTAIDVKYIIIIVVICFDIELITRMSIVP